MAAGYKVTVYYNNIAGLYRRGGPGGGWIYRVSSQMMAESRAEAPRRDGTLRRSHSIARDRIGNQYMQTYRIVNSAEHAEWVHQGTAGKGTGYIYPETASRLYIPAGNGHRSRRPLRVKGQKPNPWLDRACTRVAARYGAVGGTYFT